MVKFIWILFIYSISLVAQDRIVALSPAINEIIFALGAGDEIVGNTEYCTYPPQSKSIPKVGGYFNPNLEKILALKPTIVIMQKSSIKLSKQLNRLGINSKVVEIKTIDNIKQSILSIGESLNRKKSALKIINSIDIALEKTKNIAQNQKILIVIGNNTSLVKQIFVAGQNLYFDDIIKISGNQNAFSSNRRGQPILNRENIIATNPDIVILLTHNMKSKGLTPKDLINPWHTLPINASSKNQIYIIDKEYAGIPSDRLVLFLEDFREILHKFK